jgi:hypothetical protein
MWMKQIETQNQWALPLAAAIKTYKHYIDSSVNAF